MRLSSLTIFFPFYNDEGTVESQIDVAFKIGGQFTQDLEVIAIHGGPSKDNTANKISEMKTKYPNLVVIDKTDNKEGYAVIKQGFLTATKDWVFYTDGDAQYHLEEDLEKLVKKQEKTNADVVNGFKKHRGDNFIRTFLGNAYKKLSKKLFNLPIRDTDCDFRLIRRGYLQKIALESQDASILPELIKKLQLAGAKFVEVPVGHYNRVWGKSNYTPWSLFKEKLVGDIKLYFKMKEYGAEKMNKQEFDKINKVESINWWYVGMREIYMELLEKYLPKKDLRILDVGCGTGGNMLYLENYGEVEGIDVDEYAVKLCKDKKLNCQIAGMHDVGTKFNHLDLITLFDVLSQAKSENQPKFIKGFYNALNSGGLLLLREPALKIAGGLHDKYVNIQTRFTVLEMENLLKNAGFQIEYISYINFLLLPAIVFKRKASMLLNSVPKSDVEEMNGLINALFLSVLRLEKLMLKYIKMPLGVSIIVIARKP